MLSHRYKWMSYFQLPDFSSQPSGLCYACFCQPYSPKILSFRRCFPPIIKSHHLSIKKQQIQQQNELFRLSLCYLNTTLPSAISSDSFLSPHFQQAVQHPTIIHNSPSFAYCPSLHTQTYAPLLSCERGVQLIPQGIPKNSLFPNSVNYIEVQCLQAPWSCTSLDASALWVDTSSTGYSDFPAQAALSLLTIAA